MKEMNKMNKKGFTLIELLAVIVIMGILMMTAIPAMSKYIDNSRRDTFLDTAKTAISAARYSMLNDEYKTTATAGDNGFVSLPESGACVIIPLKWIDLEKGGVGDMSPWNKTMGESSWVLVKNTGTVQKAAYTYYFMGTDSAGNGTESKFVSEKSISRSDITKRNSTSAVIGSVNATSYATSTTDVGGCSGTVVTVTGQR